MNIHLHRTRPNLLSVPISNRLFWKRQKTAKKATVEENPSVKEPKRAPVEISAHSKRSHSVKLGRFFQKNPHVAPTKCLIPEKYLSLCRQPILDNLYLIDSEVARKAVEHVLPEIERNKRQIVSESNAGLGLIASELLEKGVKLVRLYESCPEFKAHLKDKFDNYEGRIQLFPKDIFLLHRYEYVDRQDNGTRVTQLLKDVPKKHWDDDPVMTIIGPLPNIGFIRFLIRSVVFQTQVAALGRFQLYVFMTPRDFIILTAGPHLNLHTYQRKSVLFDLFFECELLEKFPRQAFLPWQSNKGLHVPRYATLIDTDLMYFVRINFKRPLPVSVDNLLPLYSFVEEFFGRGTNKIVPALEKWFPNCGINLIVPKLKHSEYFKDLNIFTQFGELTPQQILAVFKEVISYPEYEKSHFMTMIESRLVKTDTIETSLDDQISEKSAVSSDTESRL